MPSGPERPAAGENHPQPESAELLLKRRRRGVALFSRAVAQIGSVRRVLRLTPYDTSTDAGRAAERHRRLALTALAAGFSRIVGVGVMLITVPLTLRYLGQEQYGLWMTMVALVSMMSFLDLGIGKGLISAIAEADGQDDRHAARRYVSAATFALTAICIVLLLVFSLLYSYIPWQHVLNVQMPQVALEGARAAAVLFVCFALTIPLLIAQSVQLGYQEGFRNSFWGMLGNVLMLASVLIVIWLRAGLPWLVGATAAAPLVTLAANNVTLFGFHRPWLWPRRSLVDRAALSRVLRQGMLFFVLQLAVTIGYQSDNIVINSVLGPKSVTDYAVPFRLFGFTVTILSMVLGPLWPAYGEAAARGDVAWVRRTLTRSLKLTCLVSIPPALLLVVFGKPIVTFWVAGKVVPSMTLLVGLGLWSVVFTLGVTMGLFMNGVNVIRFQVICNSLMAISNIALSIFLARRIGVSGVAYGTVVAETLCVVIPSLVAIPSILRRVGSRTTLADAGIVAAAADAAEL